MKRNQAFESRYLKTDDLEGKAHTLKIESVEMNEITDQDGTSQNKPVIFFAGAKKGMILNQTNWDTLEELYGDDSDGWLGKRIEIFPTMTRFGQKRVPAMRMRPPGTSPAPSIPEDDPAPPPEDEPPAYTDESVPF